MRRRTLNHLSAILVEAEPSVDGQRQGQVLLEIPHLEDVGQRDDVILDREREEIGRDGCRDERRRAGRPVVCRCEQSEQVFDVELLAWEDGGNVDSTADVVGEGGIVAAGSDLTVGGVEEAERGDGKEKAGEPGVSYLSSTLEEGGLRMYSSANWLAMSSQSKGCRPLLAWARSSESRSAAPRAGLKRYIG